MKEREKDLEDIENAIVSALDRYGHDRPSVETLEMFKDLMKKIEDLDKKYAKIIVEKIVFAMLGIVGAAVLGKILLAINL